MQHGKASEEKAKPDSLSALFAGKAKKKPKPTNLNSAAEKPPPPAPVTRPAAGAANAPLDEGWERALKHDQELLESCGLYIKEVEADGACLFRAFADQLSGDGGASHALFRERCVDFLEAHRDDFEPFLEEDFREYCSRMRQSSTWGGHVEAQALARCNGVNAIIYRPAEAQRPEELLSTVVEVLTSEADDSRCVQLSFHPTHHAGQHYNSVRCSTDAASGPAPAASLSELRRRAEEAARPKAPVVDTEAEEAKAAVEASKPRAKVFF